MNVKPPDIIMQTYWYYLLPYVWHY